MLSLSDNCARTASCKERPGEMERLVELLELLICLFLAGVTSISSAWVVDSGDGAFVTSCEEREIPFAEDLRCPGEVLPGAAEAGDMRLTLGLPPRNSAIGRESSLAVSWRTVAASEAFDKA